MSVPAPDADARAFVAALRRAVARGLAATRPLHALLAGRLDRPTLALWAARYYGELRVFLDVKLPERLRLCPYEAMLAKQLFARAYVEEQGGFRAGEDHATLFRRLCDALDVPAALLAAETHRQACRFAYLRALEPSEETLVRELAVTYAWESAAPVVGRALAAALAHHYGVPADALAFFTLHESVDRAHSAACLRVLLVHARTEALRALALATVGETLDLDRLLGGLPGARQGSVGARVVR